MCHCHNETDSDYTLYIIHYKHQIHIPHDSYMYLLNSNVDSTYLMFPIPL